MECAEKTKASIQHRVKILVHFLLVIVIRRTFWYFCRVRLGCLGRGQEGGDYANTHHCPAPRAQHESQLGQCLPLPLSTKNRRIKPFHFHDKDLSLTFYTWCLFLWAWAGNNKSHEKSNFQGNLNRKSESCLRSFLMAWLPESFGLHRSQFSNCSYQVVDGELL